MNWHKRVATKSEGHAQWEKHLQVARGLDPTRVAAENLPAGAGGAQAVQVAADLGAQMLGLGPLAKLLEDPAVTDVLVNGCKRIWLDRGQGLELSDTQLEPGMDRDLAVRMASACGQRLDEASPIVDGTLPGGVRLHAVIAPLAKETLISLRTFRSRKWTLSDLVAQEMMSAQVADIILGLVKQRASVLISGATGSGKTTLLNAVLAAVPGDQRILCIEEVSELNPGHPHFVQLQERHANIQGKGAVNMSELVRAAMRMRPDRIVLGECRGPEVAEVLLALNTGHSGGWATIHANSAEDVPARLQALGALAQMSERAVVTQATSALDAVIHLGVKASPQNRRCRFVSEIALVTETAGQLRCPLALSIDEQAVLTPGPMFTELMQLAGVST